MIYNLRFTIVLLLALCGLTVRAQVPPPPAASQAEVNAGTLHNKFVAPDTLAGWTGGGGGTTPTQVTNIVNLVNSAAGTIQATNTQIGATFINTNQFVFTNAGWNIFNNTNFVWSGKAYTNSVNPFLYVTNIGGVFNYWYAYSNALLAYSSVTALPGSWVAAAGANPAPNLTFQSTSISASGVSPINLANATGTPPVGSISPTSINGTAVVTSQIANMVTSNSSSVINGQYSITNNSPNTNILYLVGGTNIAAQTYGWNNIVNLYTNPSSSMQVKVFGNNFTYVTNAGVAGFYYKISYGGAAGINWSNLVNGNIATLLFNNSGGGLGTSPSPVASFSTNYTITFSTNYSTIVQLSAHDHLLSGNFVRVSPSGNDATGLRGNWNFPFKTIAVGVTNMIPADVMFADSGNYSAIDVSFPPASGFFGAGSSLTTVLVATNGVGTDAAFIFSNGGFVSGLSIVLTNQATAGNLNQELEVKGLFIIHDFVGQGEADGLEMIIGTANIYAYDSFWYSAFDLIGGVSGVNVNLFNCTLTSIKGYNGSQYDNRITGWTVQGGGSLHMYGGSISVSNSSTETVIYQAGNAANDPSNSLVYFSGVQFSCGSTNGGVTNAFYFPTAPNPLGTYVNTVGCTLNGQPLNPPFIISSTGASFTNGPSSGYWNVWISFTDAAAGEPSAKVALQGIMTNTLQPILDLTATTGTVTNFYSFPVQPYSTNSITDISTGSGASISVVSAISTLPLSSQ